MFSGTSIQYLKGVGPKKAEGFSSKGINTIDDLLYYFPRRYEDRRDFSPVSGLEEGKFYTIKAHVLAGNQRNSWSRRSFNITEAVLADQSGRINCVWFNQPYLQGYLKAGAPVILYGKAEIYNGRMQMSNPEYEFLDKEDGDSLSIGRIVPIYSLPKGFSQRGMRQLVKDALDGFLPQVKDCLPYDMRKRNNLFNLAQSLLNIHFPQDPRLQKESFTRLSFEEFLIFQLPLALRKLKRKEKKGIAHKAEGQMTRSFISGLPFRLTAAQEKVIAEIKSDMESGQVMQRLLQGDVGSGKTVVATWACLAAAQSGYQAAFMVPTEILARQHYARITSQLSGLTLSGRKIRLGLLTGQNNEKEGIYKEIKEGKVDLVIGTHALLQKKVVFKALSFIVIDEQHKFGVGQRALLPAKGNNPDVLIMTATPIPRTLAITLYGDLDISVINELPEGRLPVKTIHFSQKEEDKGFAIARDELALGRQAYIVYPVIEESYALDIAGAKKMFTRLKEEQFKGFRVGLVHGKLKPAEQEEAMSGFRNKKIDLLISTTILEVGVDVPDATCMVISHAERFGLSQLHQLRGRIGRGREQSFCVLISDAQTEDARARLNAMVASCDGFRISEEDLKIRGPGEFFGKRQHGLTELKIANPLTQLQLLKRAREEALRVISRDPGLSLKENRLLKESLLRRFPEYENFMEIG
ncbi:MAG: ATP-dependent DNA helicase RecG [Candidatus Omnitrophica bacterium]|nr:ATP-dependent DNA helicase RecG [Candidatus Omnitrophota bacterium]MDD5042461.1 ATP-dependent DNA helicase RecG [Candidatus Omnitrophota bacterium]MDD5501138.1 ATP-dependent DNA helicase RecG [Candidatus Omnitrophota bacterium]